MVNINNQFFPGGSYSFNLLNECSDAPIDFPTGTIRVIFDSVQVVGKCYNIKAESITALISVITSTVYIKLDENSSQNSEILQPKHWLFDKSERIRAVGGS